MPVLEVVAAILLVSGCVLVLRAVYEADRPFDSTSARPCPVENVDPPLHKAA